MTEQLSDGLPTRGLRLLYYKVNALYNRIRCLVNKLFRLDYLTSKYEKLHVGCGTVHLASFLNIDYRATAAADLAHDCGNLTLFKAKSFSSVYSNAFFEHLYRENRVQCLTSIRRIIKDEGIVVFVGIPDFKVIAKSYLNKAPGILSQTFDLYHVYRYTHGVPEETPDFWLEQLHKTLFDQETLEEILRGAGFTSWCLFNYCFRDEKIPLNLGFIAFNTPPPFVPDKEWLANLLDGYTKDVNKESIEIISIATKLTT